MIVRGSCGEFIPDLYLYSPCSDPSDHIGFLSDILLRIDKDKSQEAYVLLLATIARAKLIFGDIEGTKADMDAAWKVLDELSGVDSGVNAAYYSIAADYYKVTPSQMAPPSEAEWFE